MTRPRILVIGAGIMGSNHARTIAQSERCDLAGVVDPFEANGSALAARLGTTWYPELPASNTFDAAIVATPTDLHFDVALKLLSDGKPTLVEKPVTDSLATTQQLIELAEKQDVPLMCGFVERFNPAIRTAHSIVDQPLHISSVRHSPYVPRIRSGVAWDLLVHDVDLILGFNGTVAPTSSSAAKGYFHPNSGPESEDVCEALFTFPDGAVAHASASRMGHKKIRTMSITEADKLIEIDLLRRDITVYKHVSEQLTGDDSPGYRQQTIIEIPEIANNREPLSMQLDHFIDIMNGTADHVAERQSVVLAHQVIHNLISA